MSKLFESNKAFLKDGFVSENPRLPCNLTLCLIFNLSIFLLPIFSSLDDMDAFRYSDAYFIQTTLPQQGQQGELNIARYGSKLSRWEICTFCVTFCQFSWWPGIKMSHLRAGTKNTVDKYTEESNGIALFLLYVGSN